MSPRSLQTRSTPARGERAYRWIDRLRSEGGFSLIEVLVASLVLVVGLLTAASVLAISDHAIASVRGREGAVTLARQITEDVRSIDYSQISSSNIVATLQPMPGLANPSSGATWTVQRGPTANQITYTINVSVNSFNDLSVGDSRRRVEQRLDGDEWLDDLCSRRERQPVALQ